MKDESKIKIGVVKEYPALVGMMSLVGTSSKIPVKFGNYFQLSNGPRVLNFWAENLEEARTRFSLNFVRVIEYGKFCIIDDPRIPDDWYNNNSLCGTGSGFPDLESMKEIYDYLGDPNNELEQFTDPESYQTKRNGVQNPKTGYVRLTITGKPVPLKASYTLDQSHPLQKIY